MKNRITIALLLIAFAGSAQMSTKADAYFNNFSYGKAIDAYNDIDERTLEQNRNLATAYRKIGEIAAAALTYAKVVADPGHTAEDDYRYAFVLRENGQYAESDHWMESYAKLKPETRIAQSFNLHRAEHKQNLTDNGRFTIQNLDINSPQEDFGAVYFGDQVVFASSREGTEAVRRKWNWNGLPFLDLYVANIDGVQLKEPKQFVKKINNKFHEGPASFTADGRMMVFTRDNYQEKASDGTIKLKLWYAVRTDDGWSEAKEVPFNNKEYSVGQGMLTKDGKKMYFTSDMPNGVGGTDLYVVDINDSGEFGTPQNLGPQINTEANEMFPFFHEEGMLFFSSEGHYGLGGLDVFVSKVDESGYGEAKNLGVPINSQRDDLSFVLTEDQSKGYFASNRDGGKGDDDIYSFAMLRPFVFNTLLVGVATDLNTGEPLANAEIILEDDEDHVLETVQTDEAGNYSFEVDPGQNYVLRGASEGYFDGRNTASTETPAPVVTANLELEKDPGMSLYGIVTDKSTGDPLQGVMVKITDPATKEVFMELETPTEGDFRKVLEGVNIDDKVYYQIELSKEGYLSKNVLYSDVVSERGEIIIHNALDLTMDKVDVGMDLSKVLNIENIYFDYNKFNIRPDAAVELAKIIKVMNENPTMEIELGSHTDCRGSAEYNEKLSDKRAKASAQYIKSQITNPERIYGKGYGENMLVEDCNGNCKSCTDAQHQANRRTEFKIVKM